MYVCIGEIIARAHEIECTCMQIHNNVVGQK